MVSKSKIFAFFVLCFFILGAETFAQVNRNASRSAVPTTHQTKWKHQAQAAQPEVYIYSQPSFDAPILRTIDPGVYYWITEKPEGPFYTIRLAKDASGKEVIGYVPDTELDILGKGVFQPRPFRDDETEIDESSDLRDNKSKAKNRTVRQKTRAQPEPEEDDTRTGKHFFGASLVNYHENTLGGVQVGDLMALHYKRLDWQTDEEAYGLGYVGWDVMLALSAPDYYQQKTGRAASGFLTWVGVQAQNFNPLNSNTQVRYGMGPFLKYSNFQAQSALRDYSLQDLTLGVALEGAIELVWLSWGLDFGLRYNWDKSPYGQISFGVLF